MHILPCTQNLRNTRWTSNTRNLLTYLGRVTIFGLLCLGVVSGRLLAEETPATEKKATEPKDAEPVMIEGAEGKLSIPVPGAWQSKEPASNIIEHEFAAKPAEKDAVEGRLTMMMAGGSVDANVDRWLGQFSKGADGQAPKVKRETLKVNGQEVVWVDVAGTYQDRRGPFGPAVARENYRMLGAIVSMKGGGLYFLKFYGPSTTMSEHEAGFRQMVEGIRAVD